MDKSIQEKTKKDFCYSWRGRSCISTSRKNKFNLGKNSSEADGADKIEKNKDGFFSPDDILNKKSTMSSDHNEKEKIEFKNDFNVDDDESFDDWE